MVLLGTEVKSLREGKANLRDSYAVIRAGAVWLLNCHIAEYLPGALQPYSFAAPETPAKEGRDRKAGPKVRPEGPDPGASANLLPDGIAKCEIALAQGKKNGTAARRRRTKRPRRKSARPCINFATARTERLRASRLRWRRRIKVLLVLSIRQTEIQFQQRDAAISPS